MKAYYWNLEHSKTTNQRETKVCSSPWRKNSKQKISGDVVCCGIHSFVHITIIPSAKSPLSGHILHPEEDWKMTGSWSCLQRPPVQKNWGNSRLSVQTEPRGGNLLEVDTWKIALKLAENKESLFSFRLCIYVGWLGEGRLKLPFGSVTR